MTHAGAEKDPWRTLAARLALLPLRIFLGITFCYAGIDKLSNPTFLADSGSGSLLTQLNGVKGTAAVPGLVDLALHSPDLFGRGFALAEFAVGLGVLFGLWTRVAAAGGALISLVLFLTMSWSADPYYLGNDLPYLVAWLPLVLAGAPELSLDALLAARKHELTRGAPAGAMMIRRRSVVDGGVAAAALAALGGLGSGIAMWFGRRDGQTTVASTGNQPSGNSTGDQPRPSGGSLSVSALPVGAAAKLKAANGEPAYVMHPRQGEYTALSAICPHVGCEVNPPKDGRLECPCHGSVFDARTGAVLTGPADQPLEKFQVSRNGDTLHLD